MDKEETSKNIRLPLFLCCTVGRYTLSTDKMPLMGILPPKIKDLFSDVVTIVEGGASFCADISLGHL